MTLVSVFVSNYLILSKVLFLTVQISVQGKSINLHLLLIFLYFFSSHLLFHLLFLSFFLYFFFLLFLFLYPYICDKTTNHLHTSGHRSLLVSNGHFLYQTVTSCIKWTQSLYIGFTGSVINRLDFFSFLLFSFLMSFSFFPFIFSLFSFSFWTL